MLGGLLTGLLGWRWVFLVNVPLCLAAAALAPRALRESRDPSAPGTDAPARCWPRSGSRRRALALTLAEASGPLAGATLGALATAIAALALLRRVERRARDPLLDGALLRRPGFATPNLVALALTATTTPPMWLCTLHAQHVLGLSPAAAGLLFPPFNLAVVAGSLLGPRVVAAAGARAAMAGGLAGVAAGCLALLAIAPGARGAPVARGRLRAARRRPRRRVGRLDAARHRGARRRAPGLRLRPARDVRAARDRARARARHPAHRRADRHARRRARREVAGYELGFVLAAAVAGAAAVALAAGGVRVRGRVASPPGR